MVVFIKYFTAGNCSKTLTGTPKHLKNQKSRASIKSKYI